MFKMQTMLDTATITGSRFGQNAPFLCRIAVILLCCAAHPALAQNAATTAAGSVKQSIRCAPDVQFDHLVQNLQRAARRKDIAAILPHMSDDFSSRFPFELGLSDFYLAWGLGTKPKRSQLWKILPKVLRKPCYVIEPTVRELAGREGTYSAFFEQRNGQWVWSGLTGDPDFVVEE
jgi:hypothetical protein